MFCQFHLILSYLALQIDLWSLSLKLAKILDEVLFVLSLRDQWDSYEAVLHFKQNKRELLKKNKDLRWRGSVEEQGSASCCSAVCWSVFHTSLSYLISLSVSILTCGMNSSAGHVLINVLGYISERDWWNTFGFLSLLFQKFLSQIPCWNLFSILPSFARTRCALFHLKSCLQETDCL